ncbi:TlpA disulfide reductase family protein [Chitinophagaceae bacterium 26-R-25]|nr:TlpA disulfide reductase family protein [Chitinophagaceae bacterium 26-R-25]
MKKLALLLIMLPCISAWGFGQQFELNGKLNAFKPIDKILYSYTDGQTRISDSVNVINGSFQIKGHVAEPVVAFMSIVYTRKPGQQVIDDVLQFWLEPANISMTATSSLKSTKFTGSKGQADYAKITGLEKQFSPRLEKLLNSYSAARRANNKAQIEKLGNQMDSLRAAHAEDLYANFLDKNPNTPIGLYVVNMYKGFQPDADKALALFNKLPESLQQLPSGIEMKKKIETSQKTAVGKYALEFTQNDTLGKPVSLSSFKGKYVLLDFWASWCHPCRAENPNVVKAFNKYKDKNFTVVSVSLDNSKEKWLKAIHDDGMPWTHVSDLKYWKNDVAKLYGISSVPQNLLIDPQGRIVAKNLRGEALEEKLAELIKL